MAGSASAAGVNVWSRALPGLFETVRPFHVRTSLGVHFGSGGIELRRLVERTDTLQRSYWHDDL